MSQPFVGEIRMFGGNFAPAGWAFCDGQPLPISENESLFNLIGTTYGGDGQSTFALPDLRGRPPIHQGNGFILAENGGTEQVTLTVQQIAAHSHPLQAFNAAATTPDPNGNLTAQTGQNPIYRAGAPAATMNPNAMASDGGSQPHDNMQPFLCVSFIISLFGVFPSQ